jgi:hypothetical protein
MKKVNKLIFSWLAYISIDEWMDEWMNEWMVKLINNNKKRENNPIQIIVVMKQ